MFGRCSWSHFEWSLVQHLTAVCTFSSLSCTEGLVSPSVWGPCRATAGARSSEALSSRVSRWPSVYGTRRPTPWQKTCGLCTSASGCKPPQIPGWLTEKGEKQIPGCWKFSGYSQEESCRQWRGASRTAGCSLETAQIWMTLTGTLRTPPPRYSRDAHPFLCGVGSVPPLCSGWCSTADRGRTCHPGLGRWTRRQLC